MTYTKLRFVTLRFDTMLRVAEKHDADAHQDEA